MLIGRMYMQSGNGMAEQQCIPFGNGNITVFILCAIRSCTYSIVKLLVNAEWGMDIISLNGIFPQLCGRALMIFALDYSQIN